MRFVWLSLMAVLFTVGAAACGSNDGNGNPDGGNGGDGGLLPCEGIGCKIVQCPNNGTTSISGTVFAPNGTLPIYNATVYIPLREVGPLPSGAGCDRCSNLLGEPLVRTTTNEKGEFTLTNVPATTDVPVVVQIGKWRKKLTIPAVPACENTPLDAGMTRLPKNKTEGDIPQMAIATGGVDALECLLRKVGLDDSEFTVPGDGGRVHMFQGFGGTKQFDNANGGKMFPTAGTSLWDSEGNLSKYDVVFLSCEGRQDTNAKSPFMAGMKSYADKGGRVFASHWHNTWVQHGPQAWSSAFNFHSGNELPDLNDVNADIDPNFPTSMALTNWLRNVNALRADGKIALTKTQHTLFTVDTSKVERWIHLPTTSNNNQPAVQYSSIVTPIETSDQMQKCGRMVLSDIHVSGELESGREGFLYPGTPAAGACRTDRAVLTPQEKVLAFMVFDIAACVGDPIE